MRVVFVGATQLSAMTASLLVERGHEVVIVEPDKARIEEMSERLDCAFLHGDGCKPHILKEVGPQGDEILFCLTENDQTNILASLIGRSIGFGRVVPRIVDPELNSICKELGLEDTIVADQTIARHLADVADGRDVLELSTHIRGDARFFSFVAEEGDAGTIAELGLPERASAICFYRDGELHLAREESELLPGDEVVLLTDSWSLPVLQERWRAAASRRV